MIQKLSITDLARNFSDYINRVFYKRERFVVIKGNRPVAELRPIPEVQTLGDLLSMFDQTNMLSDEEAKSFAKDLDSSRNDFNAAPLRDPWDS